MNKDSETKERPCEIRCNNCSKILRATQANPNDSCSCGVKIHLYPIVSATPPETSSWKLELRSLLEKWLFDSSSRSEYAIHELISNLATSEYKRGRQSILDEWNHEKEKFTDGFNHPKDCRICLLAITDENNGNNNS